MAKKDIIQELNDLESSLGNAALGNVYSVPGGYFEGHNYKSKSFNAARYGPKRPVVG